MVLGNHMITVASNVECKTTNNLKKHFNCKQLQPNAMMFILCFLLSVSEQMGKNLG